MAEKIKSIGEKLTRERYKKSLAKDYQNEGTAWRHSGGKLTRFCSVLYRIILFYNLLIVAFNLIVDSVAFVHYSDKHELDIATLFKNNIAIVVALFVLFMSALVLDFFKKRFLSHTIYFVSSIVLGVQYSIILFGGFIFSNGTLVLMYLPAWIGLVCAITVFVIELSDKIICEKAVQKEISKIYGLFTDAEESALVSQNKWEETLVRYETEELYKERNLKKLQKLLLSESEIEEDVDD